jgi:hypothetical protein
MPAWGGRFLDRRGRVAEHGQVVEVASFLEHHRGELIILGLVQLQVADGVAVFTFVGFAEALGQGRGDDVFHAVEVEMVEVLPGADIAIEGVVGPGPHFLVMLGGQQEPHRTSGKRGLPVDGMSIFQLIA